MFNNKLFNVLKNFIDKYFLIILGFILFSLYFWNRFLRARIPKELPIKLSVLGFFTFTYICIIFIYIVISLIFPRKPNKIVEMSIEFLFTPLKDFDNYLKSLPFIESYYIKFMVWVIPKLDYLIIKTNRLYMMFWVFPRLILLSALFIDVFMFHKFHYKYMVIIFGLLLFLNRYFKYSLKKYKEDLIKTSIITIPTVEVPYKFGIHPSEYPENYDPEDPDNEEDISIMSLPLDIFINYQTESKVYNEETIEISSITTSCELTNKYWLKYIGTPDPFPGLGFTGEKIPSDYKNIFGEKAPENYYTARNFIFKKEEEFAIKAIKEIMQISLLLEYYNITSNKDKKFKLIKIVIYIIYFLCWTYVLSASISTLNTVELVKVITETWTSIAEPFSNIRIN
jgi:hypothetical protein